MKDKRYPKDLKEFWHNRKLARVERDSIMSDLTFSEKIAITESLQRDARSIKDARDITIGLGETPPDAVNELTHSFSFTQVDFNNALDKVFPFTNQLQDD